MTESSTNFRCPNAGEGHKIRCRRVTYPESYITKYTTYSKIYLARRPRMGKESLPLMVEKLTPRKRLGICVPTLRFKRLAKYTCVGTLSHGMY